jgi:hypothetical protein
VSAGAFDLDDIEPWPEDDQLDRAYKTGIVPHERRATGGGGWDAITVLRARGRRLAKLIGRDGSITSYDDAAKHFDLTVIPVDGLDHLEEDLQRLLHQHDRCIVRGRIADLGRTRGVRRLLHPDENDPATLAEVPRRWLALDVDGIARPANVPASDLVACAGIAVAALPPEFHDARCLVQATASHGFKPGLRLRLWYWLDRPVGTSELKRWLAEAPIDHALFSPAQITYVAAPLFAGGRDPLPTRLVRLPHGEAAVTVPDLPEPERTPHARPAEAVDGLSPYARAALDDACRRIINAPAGEQESTINSESFSIGTLAGAGAVPAGLALRTLLWAASQVRDYDAHRPWRPGELANKVTRAFNRGLTQPRAEGRRHGC